jgi:uncharacterized protein YndB with AHSA1/START domain
MADQMTTEPMTELTLTLSRAIPAPVARVYDAWLDPAMLRRFMIPCEGGSVVEATSDARVGGAFRIVMHADGKDIPHWGTYLDLVPHRRIVFSWQSPHSVEGSTVTLTLTPEGTGTRVDLAQVRFANEGARDGHGKGWSYILGELAGAF